MRDGRHKSVVRCGAWVLAGWLLFAAAHGAERTWIVDVEESSIELALGATMHTVQGSLKFESGRLRLDPERGTLEGRLIVDAKSAETGNRKRDRKMHDRVLESARFPHIIFRPTGYGGELQLPGTGRLEVRGTLELHGLAHPIAVTVDVTADDAGIRARALLEVPYVEWGLRDPSVFVLRVDKSVELSIDLVGRIDRAAE